MVDPYSVKLGQAGNWLVLKRGELDTGELWSLDVALEAGGLSAATSVWLEPEGVGLTLAAHFGEMSADWRGWDGSKDWEGTEGGLTLSCTNDGLGHIILDVQLNHLSGEGWSARANIPIDAGQLDEITADLHRLLA